MCICMDVLLLKGAGEGKVDEGSEEQMREGAQMYSGKKRESQNTL